MSDLTEFVLARITFDTVSATMRQWHDETCDSVPDPAGYTYPCDCGVPERMARESEAKRRMIDFIFTNAEGVDGEWGDGHDAAEIRAGKCSDHGNRFAQDALSIIASVYATHPDYDEAWRP